MTGVETRTIRTLKVETLDVVRGVRLNDRRGKQRMLEGEKQKRKTQQDRKRRVISNYYRVQIGKYSR